MVRKVTATTKRVIVRDRNCNGYSVGNSSQNQKSGENKEKKDNAPCRKHDVVHKWKDYPDNWQNKSNVNMGTNPHPVQSDMSQGCSQAL